MPSAKLLFYLPGLVDGGAERVMAVLARGLAGRGHEVTLATDFAARDNAASLGDGVRTLVLGGGHLATIRRLAALMGTEKFDCALGAIAGSPLKLAMAGWIARSTTPVLIAFHGFHEYRTGLVSRLTYWSLPVLSRRTARTITVSAALGSELVTKWHAAPQRVVTLANPVFVPDTVEMADAATLSARDDLILAVGRLSPEKDFSTLVEAFSALKNSAARLVILGDGPERPALEKMITDKGLAARVSLPGFAPEPWLYYRTAKVLAVSSQSESFGNVVVEALAHGLAVVATDCPGPREILEQGRLGTLVPVGDRKALAAALDRTLAAPGDPLARMARAADFSLEAGIDGYEALIDEVRTLPGTAARH